MVSILGGGGAGAGGGRWKLRATQWAGLCFYDCFGRARCAVVERLEVATRTLRGGRMSSGAPGV